MIYRYDEPRIEPTSVEYITSIGGLSNQTTYTINGIDFGAEVKGRNKRGIIAILKYGAIDPFTATISNASIGGNAASVVYAPGFEGATTIDFRWRVVTAMVPTGTSGSLIFTDNTGNTPSIDILRCVNLDLSAVTDSVADPGTSVSTLSVDCPADGAIIGYGQWGYSGGTGPASSATHNNLTAIHFLGTLGYAARIFAAAQTNLNVNCAPTPSSGLSRVEGMAFSFAKNPLI